MSKLLKIALLSAGTLVGASSIAAAQYADDYYTDDYYGYTDPHECAPGTSGSYVPGPDGIPQCVQSNSGQNN